MPAAACVRAARCVSARRARRWQASIPARRVVRRGRGVGAVIGPHARLSGLLFLSATVQDRSQGGDFTGAERPVPCLARFGGAGPAPRVNETFRGGLTCLKPRARHQGVGGRQTGRPRRRSTASPRMPDAARALNPATSYPRCPRMLPRPVPDGRISARTPRDRTGTRPSGRERRIPPPHAGLVRGRRCLVRRGVTPP